VAAALSEKQENYPAARDVYERVLVLYPLFVPAYKPLAILYAGRLNDREKAYQYASKAREADPGDNQVARVLGGLAYERGLYPAAVQLLGQSALANPEDADLFYMLGLAQHKAKMRKEDCRESLAKALLLAPDSSFAGEAKNVLAGFE